MGYRGLQGECLRRKVVWRQRKEGEGGEGVSTPQEAESTQETVHWSKGSEGSNAQVSRQ